MKSLLKSIKEVIANRKYKKGCKQEEAKLKKAKDEADRKHRLTGKRYFVVPQSNNSLMVINNDDLKYHNQKSPKEKRINFKQLIEMAYYSTPSGGLVRNLN